MKTVVMAIVCLLLVHIDIPVANATEAGATLAFPETRNLYLKRLRRTAFSAASMSILAAGLYAASDALFFMDHERPARAMGLTALGMTMGLPFIFHRSNRTTFSHLGVQGTRSLRIWGWLLIGVATADVLSVVIAGYAAEVNPPYGLITLAGVLTAMGFTLFAVDAWNVQKKMKQSDPGSREGDSPVRLGPWVAPPPPFRQTHHSGFVLGIQGTY